MCSCDRERNDVERLGRGQWLRSWHLDIIIKKVMMMDYGQQDTICFQKVFVFLIAARPSKLTVCADVAGVMP